MLISRSRDAARKWEMGGFDGFRTDVGLSRNVANNNNQQIDKEIMVRPVDQLSPN